MKRQKTKWIQGPLGATFLMITPFFGGCNFGDTTQMKRDKSANGPAANMDAPQTNTPDSQGDDLEKDAKQEQVSSVEGQKNPSGEPTNTPNTPNIPNDPNAQNEASSRPLKLSKKIISYYIESSDLEGKPITKDGRPMRSYPINKVPGELITHLNYSFLVPAPDDQGSYECRTLDGEKITTKDGNGYRVLTEKEDSIVALKNFKYISQRASDGEHPLKNVKVLIAIGGWGGSKYFGPAATAAHRNNFISSCLAIVSHYGLDGMDLDWEYPVAGGMDDNYRMQNGKMVYTEKLEGVPEEKELLTEVTAAFRSQLDDLGPNMLLTMATPIYVGPEEKENKELNKLENYEIDKLLIFSIGLTL